MPRHPPFGNSVPPAVSGSLGSSYQPPGGRFGSAPTLSVTAAFAVQDPNHADCGPDPSSAPISMRRAVFGPAPAHNSVAEILLRTDAEGMP